MKLKACERCGKRTAEMGFSIRKTKSKRTFTYTGDLQKAIEQAEKELAERQGSQERIFLLWQYERAKKAYEKYEERIKDVSDFVGLAKRELEKTGGKGGGPT